MFILSRCRKRGLHLPGSRVYIVRRVPIDKMTDSEPAGDMGEDQYRNRSR